MLGVVNAFGDGREGEEVLRHVKTMTEFEQTPERFPYRDNLYYNLDETVCGASHFASVRQKLTT